MMQPGFHLATAYTGKPVSAESRGKILPGNAFVHQPTPFAKPGVRQVKVRDKGVEGYDAGFPMSAAPSGRQRVRRELWLTVTGHVVSPGKTVDAGLRISGVASGSSGPDAAPNGETDNHGPRQQKAESHEQTFAPSLLAQPAYGL
jgi:hypothetical protein